MAEARQRLLVLLRGINVGGRHAVPMAMLRDLFAELGCAEIATYIQSGNVVCSAPVSLGSNPPDSKMIADFLERHLGFPVPVVLRTLPEMESIIAENPFAAEAMPAETLHVVFLGAPLPASIMESLHTKRAPGEQLAAHGRELFLHLPDGFGRSKLALACTAASVPGSPTVRNWKTVLQLRTMLAG